MSARRYLIRIFSGGITNWSQDSPNIETLAKVFDLGETEQSVYEVADGEQECLAAAAHKFTDPKKSPDAVSVLRIEPEALTPFGITIDEEQFGTTGVPRWDLRHRNLVANRDQLLRLVASLAERCHRGHDQVRRIEKQLMVRALQRICDSPPRHCPEHVKHIARWCQREADRPSLDITTIEQEMTTVQFEDEVLRPRAQRLRSGDTLKDWYDSLASLRGFYSLRYLTTIKKRFGLRDPSPESQESPGDAAPEEN